MNTVAIPASAPVGVFSAEGDLVHQAARGDSEAFAELFRRHGQMAWRLAQAIAPDRDAAVTSVANGFARALRGTRRRQADSAAFRPALLAGVYRHSIDDARARAAGNQLTATAVPKASAKGTKAARRTKAETEALTEAAFRSLPERWRAALWLTEVESIAPERVAPILGVSAAAATQLIARGQRGFAGRMTQANAKVPEHLAPALRGIALAMPANLGDLVASAWSSVAHGASARLAPLNLWLTERAARPLQVAVAGLFALGLVGIGLVGEGSSVNVPSATQSNTGGSGAGENGAGGGPAGGANGLGNGLNANPLQFGAQTGALAGVGGVAGGAGAGGTSPGGSATHTNPTTGSPGTTGGGVTLPTTGVTTPVTNPLGGGGGTTSPTTVVAVPGVASVTSSPSNGTSVNLLPSSSTGTPTASLTVGCSTGIGLTVGGIQVGCPSNTTSTTPTTAPPATTAPTTTPTTNPGLIGTILGGL